VGINDTFRALADPKRREILRLLRARDMTAGEIAKRFPQARSTLSGHFNVLKAADLVQAERRGRSIVYSLNLSVFEDAVATLLALLRVAHPGGAAKVGALRDDVTARGLLRVGYPGGAGKERRK
jgi:DNA-binding transcriptional ArsR family regulator